MTKREGSYCERGGHRIYYEVGGKAGAAPLVLIRGLARSSSYWLEFRSELEKERQVIAIDNRGVGRSDSPRLPWSTKMMADDIADVLIHSGVQRADVFGISLGGMIAQQFALRHPHRLNRLVLGATSPGGRTAKRSYPAVLGLVRSAFLPLDEALRATARWTLSPEFLARRPEVIDIWVAIARSEPRNRRGLVGQFLAAASHDPGRTLRHINAPTLLITGDADELIPPANTRLLAERIAGAKTTFLPGAGHVFTTERPVESARLTLDFIDREPPVVSRRDRAPTH